MFTLTSRQWRRRPAAVLIPLTTVLAMTACDLGLLDVPTEVVTPESTADAAGAEALRVAALNRLSQTLAGGGAVGLIPVSGLLADEFIVTSARSGLEAIDRRIVDENNEETYVTSQFQRLSQTRLFTRQAITGLQNYSPQRRPEIAQMFAARAVAEVLLAEHFCSGITLSEVVDGRPQYGEPLSNEAVFLSALAHADSALDWAAGSDRLANLARVVQARTLLNLGRFAEAGAAAAAVPTDFVYNLEFSTTAGALNNGVTTWINLSRVFSIADQKGGNGLPFQSASDPRLEVTLSGLGQDGRHEAWVPMKYASPDAPVVLADGVEARLIEAEVHLTENDPGAALAILNDLRARVPELEPLSDAGSPAARLDQLFHERAFWLFGTAHRLGDLRRLVRQHARDQATVFPVGEYFKGGDFGSEVTLPIPLSEENNPNSAGCLDRGA